MTLEEAVKLVNTHNRAGAPPIVEVVNCCYCSCSFARSVNLARGRGKRIVCPAEACQQQAKDERWQESLARCGR